MALTKETSYDYEIRGRGKNIQQRKCEVIYEDGVRLTDSYSRKIYSIGTNLNGNNTGSSTLSNLSSGSGNSVKFNAGDSTSVDT